jgi:ubiquitin carboxyl-terminal hydrolase 1
VAPPRLDESPVVAPGRGWLRTSDNAVREVGIEAVLQECSGAFMLYYERVRNGDRPVWPLHCGTDKDDDDDADGDAREVGGGGGGERKAQQTFRLQDVAKWESSEEEKEKEEKEEAPVIKARVVRSVSLGRDDEEGDADSEVRLLSSPTPTKPGPIEVESALELPTTAVSADAPPPTTDTPPAVDEPPIAA